MLAFLMKDLYDCQKVGSRMMWVKVEVYGKQ